MSTVFKHPSFKKHEQIIYCHDEYSGLNAIIAIHNTQLGSALGGCRMYPYATEQEALNDVLRLSESMTYKSAIANLNFGGGKAVIIGDPRKISSETLFRTFGRFVNSLNGRYITAEDVGTNEKFMAWIRIETKHVVGIPSYIGGLGDPSPWTAHGTLMGILASLKKQTGSENLDGIKVAVQGIGHVGYHLCRELFERGAKLFVSDINKELTKKAAEQFNATVIPLNKIYDQDVDVFSPCALGAVINDQTIDRLKCSIVSGAANNILADEEKHGKKLQKKGILYAPDFVVNAGGLLDVASEFFHVHQLEFLKTKVEEIYQTTLAIFETADQKNMPSNLAAIHLAKERIEAVRQVKNIYTHRRHRE
ncbi:MAG: hypothetical protein A2298_03240 [Gammaproteobacteria bacterium RIFOXYB2_FULL_38_6]|nr:MAG: hypothetical protein A2298_03240 [Gammaproteobacteria bacterium RIFOXYB2_FULL_38_6]